MTISALVVWFIIGGCLLGLAGCFLDWCLYGDDGSIESNIIKASAIAFRFAIQYLWKKINAPEFIKKLFAEDEPDVSGAVKSVFDTNAPPVVLYAQERLRCWDAFTMKPCCHNCLLELTKHGIHYNGFWGNDSTISHLVVGRSYKAIQAVKEFGASAVIKKED